MWEEVECSCVQRKGINKFIYRYKIFVLYSYYIGKLRLTVLTDVVSHEVEPATSIESRL